VAKETGAKRAGIYVRISQDRNGDGLGVARQEQDCRELAAWRGWDVGRVYVDDDRSAYSGKPRPAYQELLADLSSGTVDAVVAWHPDRLHRSPRELEDFIDLIEATRAAVATVQAGDLDFATPSGRMAARVVGAVARGESEHKSARIKRQGEQAAAAGRYHGGRRPYGYEPDGTTIVADEAAHLREAMERVLAGESVRAIAADWNNRGIPAASGGPWTIVSLKEILTGPRIAGRRRFRGEDVGEAEWPAIISYDEHLRLVATLTGRQRPGRGRPPAHLLTSVVRCGRCGCVMHTSASAKGGRRYACTSLPGKPACGRTAITAEPLEALIAEALLQRVDSPAFARTLARRAAHSADHDAATELAELETRLEELDHDHYVEGLLDRKRWLTTKGALEARRDECLTTVAAATRTLALDGYVGQLRAAWSELSIDKQRAILRAVIDHITINPATRPGNTLDPDRIDITWLV
jgi:DNA invertase Pin-like site-specific DNA recombinase